MKIIKSYLDKLIKVKNIEQVTLEKIAEVASVSLLVENKINNLVVGKVITCVDHPQSDHLHITTVDTGKETLQIVCGASNVKAGQTVIVALEGAKLAPDFTIKPVKLRGVESNGMICALDEIGLARFGDSNQKGIYVFEKAVKPGTDIYTALGLDDTIIDLDLTTNRGDLFSYLGYAIDLGAATNKQVNLPNFNLKHAKVLNPFSLSVESDLCHFYEGRYFSGISVKQSPQWLKNFLVIHDIKPLNNIVDITNYILIKYGCPLHAFDADKLSGHKIVVKQGTNQTVTTLANQEVKLTSDELVIADGEKSVALAGIIGLDNSKITNDTENVFLESAIFNREYIARSSSKLGISTDASEYYKRGVSQEILNLAVKECIYLIENLAGGKVSSKVLKHKKSYPLTKKIKISSDKINRYLGTSFTNETVINIFNQLGFTTKEEQNAILVIVPERRFDCNITEDLIEEFARIYGFNNLKGTPSKLDIIAKPNKELTFSNKIRSLLLGLGLNETVSYSLMSRDEAQSFCKDNELYTLPVPLKSGMDTMRPSIIPSLVKIDEYNKNHFQEGSLIFEISNVYTRNKESLNLAVLLSKPLSNTSFLNQTAPRLSFFTIKGILDYIMNKLNYSYNLVPLSSTNYHPFLQGKINVNEVEVGIIAQLNSAHDTPSTVLELNLSELLNSYRPQDPVFKPFSKYPSMVRDISFIVSKDTSYPELINFIKQNLPSQLETVELFDCFMLPDDNNSYSLSLKLKFTDYAGKLTNEETIKLIEHLKESLVTKFKVVNR